MRVFACSNVRKLFRKKTEAILTEKSRFTRYLYIWISLKRVIQKTEKFTNIAWRSCRLSFLIPFSSNFFSEWYYEVCILKFYRIVWKMTDFQWLDRILNDCDLSILFIWLKILQTIKKYMRIIAKKLSHFRRMTTERRRS